LIDSNIATKEDVNFLPKIIGVILGIRYSTETATLLGCEIDRKNQEACAVYKTPRGLYFCTVKTKKWPSGKIMAIDEQLAIKYYGDMYIKCVEFSEAFPDMEIQDA